ncbi:MAG: M20/M25/M40 family metallo-hydrolase [Chloroflexota bacterium]|nr:M20/M25/M40 family metallo-hydrolase [Chloroflexota bacterium]
MRDYSELERYVASHMPAWTEELADFCCFPSESTDLAALRAAAAWIEARLLRLGATTDVVELPGRPEVPPLVIGEIGDGPKTLNCVQHYDVQPAAPYELWTTPPYEPAVRDGRLYARGAIDDKGDLMSRILGVEAYLATFGPLPCRIRFLVEGEEEYGSAHLDELLDLRPGIRQVDGALMEGGEVDLLGRPKIIGGVRGIIFVELVVKSIAYDAHSSLATVLPSAPVRLIQALATFWDEAGRPVIDDLDAGLLPPTLAQLALVDATPTEDLEDLRREFAVDRFVGGIDGVEAIRAMTFAPTCNVQGLWSGYWGTGTKTITPAEAHARLDLRLVPEQDPAVILANLRAHLDRRGFSDVVMLPQVVMERAYWTTPDDPLLDAAARASEAVFHKPAVRRVSDPGTAPMWQVCGRDRVRMTSLGGGHDDCRAHAPDENYRLDYAGAAAVVTARFFDEFAAIES